MFSLKKTRFFRPKILKLWVSPTERDPEHSKTIHGLKILSGRPKNEKKSPQNPDLAKSENLKFEKRAIFKKDSETLGKPNSVKNSRF